MLLPSTAGEHGQTWYCLTWKTISNSVCKNATIIIFMNLKTVWIKSSSWQLRPRKGVSVLCQKVFNKRPRPQENGAWKVAKGLLLLPHYLNTNAHCYFYLYVFFMYFLFDHHKNLLMLTAVLFKTNQISY